MNYQKLFESTMSSANVGFWLDRSIIQDSYTFIYCFETNRDAYHAYAALKNYHPCLIYYPASEALGPLVSEYKLIIPNPKYTPGVKYD